MLTMLICSNIQAILEIACASGPHRIVLVDRR
jgi:hypothetical protein